MRGSRPIQRLSEIAGLLHGRNAHRHQLGDGCVRLGVIGAVVELREIAMQQEDDSDGAGMQFLNEIRPARRVSLRVPEDIRMR